MKFRGANVLPPSIALWLEQQLELRGIDSVVYTRYILSLLNDETFDLNDLTTYNKGNKKLSSWKSCNLEDLKRSAVIQCLTEAAEQAFEIESLVDELCVKLKEADGEVSGGKCLKEKTNSEDIFNLDLSVSNLDLANKYYSAFPALSKGNSFENTFPLTSVWSRNICRALGGGRRRVDSESSTKDNKVSKRKENKENVLCGLNGGARRMRSRSTVKQSSGHHRNRASAAKSLDRKEDEISTAMKRTYGATKTVSSGDVDCGSSGSFSGGGDSRGRKCLSFMHNSLGQLIGYPVSRPAVDEQIPRRRDDKLSRTPGRRGSGGDNVGGIPKVDVITTDNYDSDELPVDFQQLLTSPSDYSLESSLYKQHQSYPQSSGAPSGNFIQCGTNITSSIWSDTSEKMEEDENGSNSGNWETVCGSGINGNAIVGGNSKWSDARGSILSSAWKLPFVYDKDIEGTSLAVNASSGSFYSFFDSNPISSSYLAQNNRNTSKVGENKVEGLVGDTLRSDGEPDEDLLTSMRTHFRPIRNSDNGNCTGGPTTATTAENGCIKGGTAGAGKGGVYKNGSTFTDNSASPMKLDFKRSESGALYLITTGEKYFEFKRSSPNCLPHPTPQEPQQQLSSIQTASSTFVPKFKVRQNEKFCQTDMSPSTPSENDFFFPGDDHLAEEMLNNCCDDDDDDVVDEEGEVTEESDEWFDGRRSTVNGETRQAIQVSGWVTAWPVAMDSSAAIWASAADNSNAKAWVCSSNGGGARYVGPAGLEDSRMDDRNEHYLRLRDELSEEGEELLSDLSSIHLFLDPERMDEPNPHMQAHCSKNVELRQCLQEGNFSNENFF